MKLLIVEDEEYIADFMMIGLEKAGYECEIAMGALDLKIVSTRNICLWEG